jgi:WD40-like Beta Propeller Repeat
MLAFAGTSARAAVTHAYLPEVSKTLTEGVPAGSGAPVTGPVSNVGSMTVDSGHLWIAEQDFEQSGAFRVDQFDGTSGTFISQLPQVAGLKDVGRSVAVSHGTVYAGAIEPVTGEGRVVVFGEAGVLQATWTGASTPAGSFGPAGEFAGVAVDRSVGGVASGSVYVADERQGVVDVFKPEGLGSEPPAVEPSSEHVSQLTGTCPVEGTTCEPLEVIPFSKPGLVAVDDSTGDVLVVDGRTLVDVFRPEPLGGYVFVRQITGTPAGLFRGVSNLTVDGANGEIYVTDGFSPGFVDQFSSTGVFLGRITGENTPGGDLRDPSSVAIDPESHNVFVGDYRPLGEPRQPSVIDAFGPDLVIPDVTTGPATGVTPYGATLTGTVNLDKEGEATCQFLWGTTKEFGQTAPCSAPVTVEESAVQATLSPAAGSKLEPDTTYYYRLQATNKKGLNPGEPSQDQEFTTSGPGIHEEAVSNVAATSVTFTARINPHNAPTTAYFQYGTSSGYGTNLPAPPGPSLGSGEGDVEAAPEHVQGLSAGTVYHYRVVAISEPSPGVFEEFDGPDQTFTTQTSGRAFELPDGRSWELVTPAEKKGALFSQIIQGIIQASSNGDAIADLASQPTEAEPLGYPSAGGVAAVSVLSTRGSDGWSSQDISPPNEEGVGIPTGNGAEYRFFSEDLSLGIVQPFGQFTPLSPEASEPTAYLRRDYLNGNVSAHCQTSCFEPLVTAGNTPPGTVFGEEPNGRCEANRCGAKFIDATPDLSHIVLKVKGLGFVEWVAGKLTSTGGVVPGNNARHGISNDGSRIIGGREESKGLFLRDMVKGETVQLDLPQGGVGVGSQDAVYMTASSDDSRIFFLDDEHLTAESSTSGPDLYEYNLNAPLGSHLTDLTVDKHANEIANVVQVVGASEDGSFVYFTADGALAPGATRANCSERGETARCNLYVRHAGATSLVAALSTEDYRDWAGLVDLPVRVSPNGRWLAFMSNRGLTGYDTHDAFSGRPDQEVYLYDAHSDRLVCASCNPSGARPVGFEYDNGLALVGGTQRQWFAANVPGWTNLDIGTALYQSRYLSDSGRLFFNSNDALVPQDVNGTQDVYEYEPVGVASGGPYVCTGASVTFSVRSGGCVGLVSSGASAEESAFLDGSATGGDVFFLTAAKLVSQDFDTALDVYDAHECTEGSPCFAVPPVPPPACSTGDSCKAAPSPQPALFGSPSSATFSGAGNVTPAGLAPTVKSRSLTRAQKLARAVRACQKRNGRVRRAVCVRNARKRYGPAKTSGKANAMKKSGR